MKKLTDRQQKAFDGFCLIILLLGGLVLGPYTSMSDRILCVCPNGHLTMTLPRSVKDGHGMCRECAGNCPELSKRNFRYRVEVVEGGTVNGTYIRNCDPIACTCKRNHPTFVRPDNLRNGKGIFCKQCRAIEKLEKDKLKDQEFKQHLVRLRGIQKGNFVNMSTPINCLCERNHPVSISPTRIRYLKNLCLRCVKEKATEKLREKLSEMSKVKGQKDRRTERRLQNKLDELEGRREKSIRKPRKPKMTEEEKIAKKDQTNYLKSYEAYKELEDPSLIFEIDTKGKGNDERSIISAMKFYYIVEEEIGGEVLEDYINSETKIKCLCPCGDIVYPWPCHVLRGIGICLKCSGKSATEAGRRYEDLVASRGGQVVGDYINNHTRVACVGPCGCLCYPLPSKIVAGGNICRKCKLSKGERMVSDVLKRLGIEPERQVKHPRVNKLTFDFRFFDYTTNKMIYIEFDGRQHQEDIEFFGRRKDQSFEQRRQKDLMKNFIISTSPNTMLIRLDHRWVDNARTIEKIKESETKLEEYLLEAFDSNEKIVASEIYTWVSDLPKQETIDKYLKKDEYLERYEKEERKERIVEDEDVGDEDDEDFSDDEEDYEDENIEVESNLLPFQSASDLDNYLIAEEKKEFPLLLYAISPSSEEPSTSTTRDSIVRKNISSSSSSSSPAETPPKTKISIKRIPKNTSSQTTPPSSTKEEKEEIQNLEEVTPRRSKISIKKKT